MAKEATSKSAAPTATAKTPAPASVGTAASQTSPSLRSMPAGTPFFELSRLMVVAIDTAAGRLIQKAQTAPNGPWPADWSIIAPGTFVQMTAGLTKDGRVAVVAQLSGTTNLSVITEDANQIGPIDKWSAPQNIGAPPIATSYQKLSMANDADGRIEIFVTDNQGNIWWIYQNPDQIVQVQKTITPPGTKTPIVVTVDERVPPAKEWSDWLQIPGGLVSVRAIRQADGRIALFGINSGLHLYRCQQSTAEALKVADWTQWVQIDTTGTGGFTEMAPIVGPLGATNLFALTQSGQVLHTRQKPAGTDSWSPWAMTEYSRVAKYTLAAGIEGNGDIMLVASDQQHVHSFNAQYDAATQNWSGWRDFNASGANTRLTLDYNADGRVALFSLMSGGAPNDNSLWTLSQMNIDSTEWEDAWVSLASSNVNQAIVVRDLTPPV
ncbi:VCBS repeat-containing protein [Mesorhizobium huakuii]|uniref:VCBS repeat-containing protein n=1 Tax=Mesorhizobium huakuii TaxID=28104 RepID=A0A7G6SSX1_9HYPH|nr:VCBS repeat-containing protein [Mesorhizobium huakuii]QND57603.1 VCBS repeat-containing protein [Mesorhizobium huakuii]